jgi:hypothetical protein
LDVKASKYSRFIHYGGRVYGCFTCMQGCNLVTGFIGEFGRMQDRVKVFCDSQSAIHLARNLGYHSKTKYIYVKYHFVRQVFDEGGVSLEKVHTKMNSANMFTKPVLLEKLRWCLSSLGLQKR